MLIKGEGQILVRLTLSQFISFCPQTLTLLISNDFSTFQFGKPKECDTIKVFTFNSNFGLYICHTSARHNCDENIRSEIKVKI
jgi:hypothetical protein